MTTLPTKKALSKTLGAAAATLALGATLLAPTAPANAAKPHDPGADPGPKSAAKRNNWGTPLPESDEFNYVGTPDRTKWMVYGQNGSEGGAGSECWPGHNKNGRRCVKNNHVNGEYLRQTGEESGDSAGVRSKLAQKYGRWEVRARVNAAKGATGHAYHPVLITWPHNDKLPSGAEYDLFEVNVGNTCASAFLHYPNHQPKRQEEARLCPMDLSKWHNYGFEWSPEGLTGYIDGVEWFHYDQDGVQNAPTPMAQTIQLDNFFGKGGMQEAYFDVDWSRVYAIPGVSQPKV
ncbi:glycoside hydrolase family 16 protein [Mariniluteicoccus flavus]